MNTDTMGLLNAAWPFVMMGLLFYFMLWRPQKKQQKQRANMLESLKVGSQVITIGGIVGEITKVHDDKITIKIAENVEIKVIKAAIGSVQSQGAVEK